MTQGSARRGPWHPAVWVLMWVTALAMGLAGAGTARAQSTGSAAGTAAGAASGATSRWDQLLQGAASGSGAAVSPAPGGGGRIDERHPPPPPTATDLADPATREAYRAAVREYYTYLQQGLQHRQRVFVWQHRSSIAIFVVVVLLVGVGVYFAAVQFHRGLQVPGPGGEATQFEAGPGGLKVSSPVLGVIILVISLAFFYLYLRYVYPIQELF